MFIILQKDKGLQHESDTLNLMEEKVENSLDFTDTRRDFLNKISIAQAQKTKNQ